MAYIPHHMVQRLRLYSIRGKQGKQGKDYSQYLCHLSGLRFMAWRKLDISGMGSLSCTPLFTAYSVRTESPLYRSTRHLASFAVDSVYICACCLWMDPFPRREYHAGMAVYLWHSGTKYRNRTICDAFMGIYSAYLHDCFYDRHRVDQSCGNA